MNNNARYDRPTDTFDLEVNVPRTIGILRDARFSSARDRTEASFSNLAIFSKNKIPWNFKI